jgi:hypothetical protein
MTIDTLKFRELLRAIATYRNLGSQSERGAVEKLIAHIDAKIAEAVKAERKRCEKEQRDDQRSASTESMWKKRQGKDYGSY